ncbi:MAG: amidohydrolase family protein, partial [Deltaproteobacteria bacterium]|nr:amidohydrolase family protein [Deltaproteobacteria bacterium]
MTRLVLVVLACVVGNTARADCTILVSRDADAPGTVMTPEGRAEGAAVVVDGARIVAVGDPGELEITAAGEGVQWRGQTCAEVDISGRLVTPGFVAVATQIGVMEISMEPATVDAAGEDDRIRAALRVVDAYDPRSTLIPVTRIAGVTSSVVLPAGGVVSGQAGWVDLAGARQEDQVQDPSVAMVASIDGASRAEGLLRLREVLDDARYYGRNRAAFDQNRSRSLAASRLDLEALQPVVRGEVPLAVYADRAADIEALVRFGKEEEIRIVLFGGAEAWMVAEALAEADVPVVVDPFVYGPGSFDEVHARGDNPALLAAAGVTVLLTRGSSHNARLVPQLAGNAVRGGMAWEDALAAVTSAPAEVFGMPDHGVIRAGAWANLVVWGDLDGKAVDPFELSSTVA